MATLTREKFGHSDRLMLDGLLKAVKAHLTAARIADTPPCTSRYRGAVRVRMIAMLHRKAYEARTHLDAVIAEIEGEIAS